MVTICTASLTFNNSTFCPHTVFMCFVWIWEQTAIISLCNINWLVFITEIQKVYCAVRTGSLYTERINLSLWMAQSRRQQHRAAHNILLDVSSCTINQAAPLKYAAERRGDTKLCCTDFMFYLKTSYNRQNFFGCLCTRAQSGHVPLCSDSGRASCRKLPGKSS